MMWVSPDNTGGPEDVPVGNDFLKIAVRLSHSPSVVLCVLREKESFHLRCQNQIASKE